MKQREQQLIDIGSTTALSALVEIVDRRSDGILARQANAMLARLEAKDHRKALEGFCEEIQSWVESVPGAALANGRRGHHSKARRS